MKALQAEDEFATNKNGQQWLETVRRQVASVRFGVVQVVVHDSRVVQIEKTEKIRVEPTAGSR